MIDLTFLRVVFLFSFFFVFGSQTSIFIMSDITMDYKIVVQRDDDSMVDRYKCRFIWFT